METILEALGAWISSGIGSYGYLAIAVFMAIESACIPLPSELIMPFAGILVAQGKLGLFGAGLAGAVGCVAGSLLAWVVGATGGRSFIERYGRYALITMKDLDRSEEWFRKHGNTAIFTSRLLPVVRTFISLPAGIARMPLLPFIVLTFLGSLPWCLALAWLGVKLGNNFDKLKKYFHGADAVIVLAVLVGGGYFLWHRIKELREESEARRAARQAKD